MSIAAFILSILGGILSFLSGGCGLACGGGASQYSYQTLGYHDKELMGIGAGGLLILIASIVGFVGGSMAFTRKAKAKIWLGVSTGLCLIGGISGNSYGYICLIFYAVAAFLAHLDTKTELPASSEPSNSASTSAFGNSVSDLTSAFGNSVSALTSAFGDFILSSKLRRIFLTPSRPITPKNFKPILGIETTALIKRGKIFIGDDDFDEAECYFEQALRQDSENAQAYIGKLMAEQRVHNLRELSQVPFPLSSHKLFKRAFEFAGENAKATLQKCLEANDAYLAQLEDLKKREQEKRNPEAKEKK